MSDSPVVRLKNESDLPDTQLRTLLQTDEFYDALFAAADSAIQEYALRSNNRTKT